MEQSVGVDASCIVADHYHHQRSKIVDCTNVAHSYVDTDRVGQHNLFGAEHVLEFLRRHLITDRCEMDPVLLPQAQILMLYGRPGTGKRTCLHYVQDPDSNLRVFLECTFAWVKHFRLQEWDDGEFVQWCEQARDLIRQMNVTRAEEKRNKQQQLAYPSGPESLLLVIGDLHYMNGWRNPEPKFALQNLMQTIKECSYNRRDDIRMVITCGEAPGKFGERVLSLVDRKCFMGTLSPEDRGAMFIYWMHRFKLLANREPRLKKLEWSIKLDVETIEHDPGHVVNNLIRTSNGCTAREVFTFMRRTFDACSCPREDGMTDYSSALIDKMMYVDEQQKQRITPYNTATMNAPILQYTNLDPEIDVRDTNRFIMTADDNAKCEFKRANNNDDNDRNEEEEEEQQKAEGKEPSTKKRKPDARTDTGDQPRDNDNDGDNLKIRHSNAPYRLRVSDALKQADIDQQKRLRFMHIKQKRKQHESKAFE